MTITLLIIVFIVRSSPPSRGKIKSYVSDKERISSMTSIPPQCKSTLEKAIACQKETNKETIVFACHRKWCNSFYGHCETVNGIGDRTKHMLSMFSDALDKCLRVELDYPQKRNGIELRFQDFEYRDKWGIWAELFHFRSYDVSDLKVNVDEWGKDKHSLSRSSNSRDGRTFVHFIPSQDQYQFHRYDPCLYHILFKTTPILDTEIHYYSDLIGLTDKNNVIGMHFRTGDLTAFNLKNNDIRTSSDSLIKSYNVMMNCAQIHASNLGIQPEKDGKIKLFLATDNQIIKDRARKDKRFSIFMTENKPTAYIRSEGDRSAYTDLYLLSKTKGLVVNELPNKYVGRLAEKISTFAQLAMSIGFMTDMQLHRCKLED